MNIWGDNGVRLRAALSSEVFQAPPSHRPGVGARPSFQERARSWWEDYMVPLKRKLLPDFLHVRLDGGHRREARFEECVDQRRDPAWTPWARSDHAGRSSPGADLSASSSLTSSSSWSPSKACTTERMSSSAWAQGRRSGGRRGRRQPGSEPTIRPGAADRPAHRTARARSVSRKTLYMRLAALP